MIPCEVFWDFLGLGQKVSWENMADSETQPGEPVNKEAFSACLVERSYIFAISVSQQVGETLSQLVDSGKASRF